MEVGRGICGFGYWEGGSCVRFLGRVCGFRGGFWVDVGDGVLGSRFLLVLRFLGWEGVFFFRLELNLKRKELGMGFWDGCFLYWGCFCWGLVVLLWFEGVSLVLFVWVIRGKVVWVWVVLCLLGFGMFIDIRGVFF